MGQIERQTDWWIDTRPVHVCILLNKSVVTVSKQWRYWVYSSCTNPHHYRNSTCHMGSYSVTCHPAEVTFPPLSQPIKAGTRFNDPGGMQGWVNLVYLVTYRGGIPAGRRSPIPVLTGLNVEQLRSCDEWC